MPDPTTAATSPNVPGVSRLILVADETFPRYSEGDVIELSDRRLLLSVGRKAGASDFAAGEIVGMFSSDGGVTWDGEPHVIKQPFDALVDLMSTSFCRTPRGLHLFFLGRGRDAKGDTQPYQMLSTDEGRTWGEPERVALRGGYYVVNNARVIRTSRGRMLVPAAYVGRIDKDYNGQSTLVLYSDDDGVTWRESNVLSLAGQPLMEPGLAECADGSIYMTIRTAMGVLYEARSRDGGATWADFGPTKLPSPAAPSTVVRAPDSNELWMFWCNNAKANWKQRSPQVFARSSDHGKTWSEPRVIEHHPKHSYGYISFTRVNDQALLTYYDWHDDGQPGFHMTSLRQRTIPLAWLRGEPVPPVLRKQREPLQKQNPIPPGRIHAEPAGSLVLRSDLDMDDLPGMRFHGMQVFRYRGFYLGLLHLLCDATRAIQPQWAWSHNGMNWVRTGAPCIPLGDRGTFDSREIVFGDVLLTETELIGFYRRNQSDSALGRSVLPLPELDDWLDTLPQP